MHVPSLQRSLPDVVAEYDAKVANIDIAVRAFERACDDLKDAAAVAGTFGGTVLDGRVSVYRDNVESALVKSAWRYVYKMLNLEIIASARDRKLFEQDMAKPAPFTLDNIRATFGRYILDPRGSILRGLAEVFCDLDQAYRSHEKMKIGVAGLPKRVVLTNVAGSSSWGRERLVDMLNALASYRGEQLIEYGDMEAIDALYRWNGHLAGEILIGEKRDENGRLIRKGGLKIRKFKNGNAHVFFDKDALLDVNRALAEYYGDVLPDCPEERPQKQASTEVSKDLAFYPTPPAAITWTLGRISSDFLRGKKVLEPSCGVGGFMIALHNNGADVRGFEFDANRAGICRSKGLRVQCVNFLATEPCGTYDVVVMNPPFAGKHYAKHVRHAYSFLKPGGHLFAILPATAREHGLLDDLGVRSRYSNGPWQDLPVGSFSESGTNINTTLLTLTAPGS